MARLIPSFFDDRTPPGEIDVFNRLSHAPDNWVAIHSLDLAPWNRGLRTEIDFLIVVPDLGIACVEVKSHEKIEFDGHAWSPPSIKRSPFKQALDGRYTFARRLADLVPSLAHVPVVHLCIFPRARFDITANVSVQSWELIDRRAFLESETPEKFASMLRGRMERSISADGSLRRLPRPLTATQVQEIVDHCVPVQRRRPAAREEIEQRREEIERILRVQQKPVLVLSHLNARLLVTGPAGTGKTLIALEVARRAAEAGKRVGLFCFNQIVGDWMAEEVSRSALPNLVAGPAIRMMSKLAGIHVPENPDSRYWEHDLPNLLEDRLTDPEFRAEAVFDYLVVDEVQDLMSRPDLWHATGMFLLGGFERGSYALFGDFANQALGREGEAAGARARLMQTASPTCWELSENCRNYKVVGEAAAKLAGSRADLYSGYLRTGGSARDYDIQFYADDEQQDALLVSALREFRARGFRAGEITLLSFRSDEQSAAARLRAKGAPLAKPWPPKDVTSYSTVHAFKGMENRVIILTDLVLNDANFERSVFYTGLTRATESALVICHVSSRATLANWLTS